MNKPPEVGLISIARFIAVIFVKEMIYQFVERILYSRAQLLENVNKSLHLIDILFFL